VAVQEERETPEGRAEADLLDQLLSARRIEERVSESVGEEERALVGQVPPERVW